jgi:hypothetical protein
MRPDLLQTIASRIDDMTMSTPSSDSHQDGANNFFSTLAQTKTVSSPARPGYRRLVGTLLGLAIGLTYGFVSQGINKLSMPGIPYLQHPSGLAGNLLIIVISGVVIGFVCAAPKSSSNGAVRASMVVVLAVTFQWLASYRAGLAIFPPTHLIVFGIGAMFIGAIPAMMLLRLAIDIQTESRHKPVWAWTRIRVPVGILALVGFAGIFQIYPDNVRLAFADLHALIQAGLSVEDPADLPLALREENSVIGFLDFATADYVLEESSIDRLWIDLTTPDELGDTVLMARFKRGGILACAYNASGVRLRCKSYIDASVFQQVASAYLTISRSSPMGQSGRGVGISMVNSATI